MGCPPASGLAKPPASVDCVALVLDVAELLDEEVLPELDAALLEFVEVLLEAALEVAVLVVEPELEALSLLLPPPQALNVPRSRHASRVLLPHAIRYRMLCPQSVCLFSCKGFCVNGHPMARMIPGTRLLGYR